MTGFTPPHAGAAPPVIERVVVRYAKRGRMRFASHRDVARAVERGVRRAGLPIAYSAGFTPHPKISYAGAAPTGMASEAEYLELSLSERCAVSEVAERLDAALPDGIDVIEVIGDRASLASLPLEASLWQVVLPGVSAPEAAGAVAEFLAHDSVEVERLTSKGTRRVDARAAVITMRADSPETVSSGPAGGNTILRMVVRHVVPAVRPDDIVAALRRVAALEPPSPPMVTRLAQGALDAVAAGLGRSVASGQVKTTRHGEGPAPSEGALRSGAYDQPLRGADGPARTAVPGGLTGDNPDARQRAERHRVHQ